MENSLVVYKRATLCVGLDANGSACWFVESGDRLIQCRNGKEAARLISEIESKNLGCPAV